MSGSDASSLAFLSGSKVLITSQIGLGEFEYRVICSPSQVRTERLYFEP